MSVKTSVVDILSQTKTNQQDAVGLVYDNMIVAVNALPDDVDGDITALQAQVADLQGKLDAAMQVIAADAVNLDSELTKEAKLQATIDAIKAALAGLQA